MKYRVFPLFVAFSLLIGVLFVFSRTAFAACSLTVDNTNNSGAGSLRDAIQSANVSSDVDTICFNIPGSGVHTISPTSSLPSLTQPVIVDGSTQPGYVDKPLIEISGASAGSTATGLVVNGGNSTIKALAINRFAIDGMLIQSNGGNVIVGNFMGVDPAGTTDLGNGSSGIGITVSNNTIGDGTALGRNIISGNNGNGLVIAGSGTTNNTVKGNFIGTNASGTGSIKNTADGLLIVDASSNTVGGVNNVTPAGACSGDCNVISGNGANGVGIWKATARGNRVVGNFLGLQVNGSSALGNADIGIEAQDAPSNTVGGTTPEERNVISGNKGAGVSLTGSSSTGNIVEGNYIGVNSAGNSAIKNYKMGVNIGSPGGGTNNAKSNTIGGTAGVSPSGSCVGACNVISGNAWNGIYISGSNGGNNSIVGNRIGSSASGGITIPNILDGIGIVDSPNNKIGGPVSSARNVISGNKANGIAIVGGSSNGTRIEGNYIGIAIDKNAMPNIVSGVAVGAGVDTAIISNSIYGNGFLGIDLNLGGVTPNDGGDADNGANRLQNFPVLNYAIPIGSKTNFAGSLNSNASTSYRIDFFHSPACSPYGYGQGQIYFGSTTVSTDASGNTAFNILLPGNITGGRAVTATATKLGGSTPFETSEFSKCIYTPRQHPDGALIRPVGSQNIFQVVDGKNQRVGSVAVMLSHHIDPSLELKTATNADTNAGNGGVLYFKEGALLKGSGPNVYILDEVAPGSYQKRLINSASAFNNLGYASGEIIKILDHEFPAANGANITALQHPDGTVVKSGNSTLYWLEAGKKRKIGTPAIFKSNRFIPSQIKNATSQDLALADGPNMVYREGSLLKAVSGPQIYVVDNTISGQRKRLLANPAAFIELGFSLSEVLQVQSHELPVANGPGI